MDDERKSVSERELRRLATRRERYGPEYESKNARHAAQFNKTKFNSQTGRTAALKRQADIREKKRLERGNTPGGENVKT